MVDIKPTICRILTNAGLHCLTEFPLNKLPRLQSPMVTVGVKGTEIRPAAIGGYLGLNADLEACIGSVSCTTILLDAYSPYKSGGNACYETMKTAVQALMAGGTSQNLRKIRAGNVHFDANTDCYRCSALLTFEALNFQANSV